MTDEIKVLKFYEGVPVNPPDPDDPLFATLQVIKTVEQIDSTTTGANATTVSVTASIFTLTDPGLVSIDMIPGIVDGQVVIIHNRTGGTVTFNNLTGATAANQIDTGTGANLAVEDGAAIIVNRAPSVNKIQIVGGSGGGGGGSPELVGSIASPEEITASTGIPFTSAKNETIIFVESDGGSIDITASPKIAAGSFVGQKLKIRQVGNTNLVNIDNGDGVFLAGTWYAQDKGSIDLWWNGGEWEEINRITGVDE